jgi:hypothetical protein
MANRGTKKRSADQHEQFIADQYNGVLTKNSGAGDGEKGDVKAPGQLIECKYTGAPGEKPISKPKVVKEFETIADHAWAAGVEPVLALRYFLPDSPLADRSGHVDLSVRLVEHDVLRAGVTEWRIG